MEAKCNRLRNHAQSLRYYNEGRYEARVEMTVDYVRIDISYVAKESEWVSENEEGRAKCEELNSSHSSTFYSIDKSCINRISILSESGTQYSYVVSLLHPSFPDFEQDIGTISGEVVTGHQYFQ